MSKSNQRPFRGAPTCKWPRDMQISWKRTSRQPIRDGDEGKNCKKMNSLCVFFVITKKRVFPLAKTPLPRRRLLPIFSPKIPFHFASCRSSFWEKLSNQSQPKKEGNVFGYWVNSFFFSCGNDRNVGPVWGWPTVGDKNHNESGTRSSSGLQVLDSSFDWV